MAVGPVPEVTGRLRVGAMCVTCTGPAHQSNMEHYNEYGGSFCPQGTPLDPCTDDSCSDEDTCYTPKSN